MSENVPERATGSENPSAEQTPPPACGGEPSSSPPSPSPDGRPAAPSAPTGPHYGPAHRYGRQPAVPTVSRQAASPTPAQPAPPPRSNWSPGRPLGSPPAPHHAPWGPPALAAPGAWGPPPPPWGPAGPWAPPRRNDYASWGRRVAATAIDAVPGWIASAVLIAGYLPVYAGLFRGDLGVPPRYGLVLVGTLLYLGAFALVVYNAYFLAGRTGQSYGKRVMGIWLVSRRSGRPIGPFNAFLRNLLHIVDGIGYVGYFWPLWDDERQTLADKLAETVVVRTPVAPLTELERRQG